MQKYTEGLFMGGKPKPAANPQLQSGHVEESNVNALGEMVKMIQGVRTYELAEADPNIGSDDGNRGFRMSVEFSRRSV
ncbi:MAG: flagellar basal body rod C-terminal domain-containing protein [Nitrospiraceae bacterium]